MKKNFTNLLLVLGIVLGISVYAESTADWMQKLDQMLVPVMDTNWNTIEKWNENGELMQKAVMSGNWPSALEYGRKWFAVRQGRTISVVEASNHLQMSMLLWNNNMIEDAKKSMVICINVLRNDPNIDSNGCQPAEMLYVMMIQNKLQRPISSDNYFMLLKQVMAIAEAQWKAGLERMKNQNDMFRMFRD